MDSFVEANRALWNGLVDIHLKSAFYDVDGFLAGTDTNGDIERRELGDVSGKRMLHLLCHFGMDTLSWARQGAIPTGIDISDAAIAAARGLAKQTGLNADFVCCDVADTEKHVTGPYDIVFLSWGALCWIRDFPGLARMAAALLAPGGCFYAIDGHPMALAADETWTPETGPIRLTHDYQSGAEPEGYDWGPDYADPTQTSSSPQAYDWGHGLGRVVTSLIDAGLTVDFLHEHDRIVWRMFPGMVEARAGWWRLPDGMPHMPVSYSIRATKR
ncbi:MAG: methyltransferase domain-containing protein [Alphaproteobacteria bacterium]